MEKKIRDIIKKCKVCLPKVRKVEAKLIKDRRAKQRSLLKLNNK